MKLTRPAALLALLAALVVAGCGDDASDESASASTASGAFPVTVEHKFGSTEVKSEPKRVVVVGYTEQDIVYALGVEPVGVRAFLGGYDWKARPWAEKAVGDADPAVVGEAEINYEKVAAQRPDLIIAMNTGQTKADYDRLSKIAPTIAQSKDFIDFGMPWDEQTLMIGRALGREDKAKEIVDDVDKRFEKTRKEHPEFAGKTAILAYGGPDGYGAYSSQDTRSRFFTDLGFKMPDEVDELAGDAFFTEFSQEQFRLMDQEAVVMFGAQSDIAKNAVFKRLDAVDEDRVIYLDLGDQFAGALGFSSPLSLPYLLDEQADNLAAAVDGDPATKVRQPE